MALLVTNKVLVSIHRLAQQLKEETHILSELEVYM